MNPHNWGTALGQDRLVVRKGKDHMSSEMGADRAQYADWFERHLKAPAR